MVGGEDCGGNVLLPEWQGRVTMLAAISSTGRAMPPMYSIEGVNMMQSTHLENAKRNGLWIPGTVMAPSGINHKTKKPVKGGMTRELWREYFLKVFLPNLSEAEKPALLIIDGHDSHFDLEFMLQCHAQGVDVVQEPANCSSVLQALDQVCFKVLKLEWRKEMANWKKTLGIPSTSTKARMTRWDVPILLARPFRKAFSMENCLASFRRAGIEPLDVNVPLARVPVPGNSRARSLSS